MPHLTSTEMAARIQDLYGTPLAELKAHAQSQPPGMLAALLAMHHDLAFAEQSITFHRDRLTELVRPERQIGAHEASHVLDCARQLAVAVAVRDVQAKAASGVLQSLGRVAAPEAPPAPVPTEPAVPAAPAPAANAARSR
ncbi:hypothetical protein ADK78_41410 [Kitasatospora aureofaciens]|uniref:Uncharacterized protein n=2 Tax=Streptomyces rimosus subsp. rimosus TaxID=132474 RepID=L8F098_STRR1|nr:hypothetical protein [Streptomyces rimosus]KOG67256.1 hypothetical protein ADK78_41410 [Kitasatospora aureofaciens]MYT41855.1 hypothetical protein [Streptomyces sp. SID5471]QGY68653.1 hypothetical protein V519_024460 [Streptomyces rimosus R6-500]KUJ25243.1 hypothetical protein ADK46_41465 [Streptomyces rimosus subsp. rimosus]QDA02916.1 hypothetical protein CTZ40_03185 [Streptomyces rimosus]